MIGIEELTKYRLCYLATPYSKFSGGINTAFVEASVFAARLLVLGVKVYSPIAHTHPLAIYGNIDPRDLDIWLSFNATMMELAEALIVAEMPGWLVSKGIKHEIDVFTEAGKPVHFLPGDMFK